MSIAELDSIEWRGLAVRSVNVRRNGLSLELDAVPNSIGGFSEAILELRDAYSMNMQVTGMSSAGDIDDLVVQWLVYTPSAAGQISGSLGLMHGQGGFWEVDFNDANWRLQCSPPMSTQAS